MKKILKVCPKCGIQFSGKDICPKCGGNLVCTPCIEFNEIQLGCSMGPERIDRFFAWKYGDDLLRHQLSLNYTQEELEQIYICPRCGSLSHIEGPNNCRFCGTQTVPTSYKYEEILQRDMTKEDFAQWKKILYGEYCYPSPLFDKEELHRTRILKGEEEDPDKKQEEQMEQILDAIRWAGSRNL